MKKVLTGCLLFSALTACSQDSAKTTSHNWQITMTKPGEPGKKFTLDIIVKDISTKQPVKDAEIFAYHTNYKGDYENDPKTGIAKIYGTAWSNETGLVRYYNLSAGL